MAKGASLKTLQRRLERAEAKISRTEVDTEMHAAAVSKRRRLQRKIRKAGGSPSVGDAGDEAAVVHAEEGSQAAKESHRKKRKAAEVVADGGESKGGRSELAAVSADDAECEPPLKRQKRRKRERSRSKSKSSSRTYADDRGEESQDESSPASSSPPSPGKKLKKEKKPRKEKEESGFDRKKAKKAKKAKQMKKTKKDAKDKKKNKKGKTSKKTKKSKTAKKGSDREESMGPVDTDAVMATAPPPASAAPVTATGGKTPAPSSSAGAGAGKICRFFLQGSCGRGDDCRFHHPSPEEIAQLNPQVLRDAEMQKQRGLRETSLILFYQYVEPMWTSEERENAMDYARAAGERHGITGRLRTAHEGFNGTLTGSEKGVRDWCEEMRKFTQLDGRQPCTDTDFKLTDGLPNGQAFPQLNVFPVVELVNYGLAGYSAPALKTQDGAELGGQHLDAADYHKKMEEPDTVIIDVRNSYEVEVGHFKPPPGGAEFIDPGWRVSTEFPDWIAKPETQKKLEGKQVMMYCTGGIRCERASAYARQVLGDKIKGVYQLQGGIERYLKAFPDDGGHWKGKNYVFDKRFVHGPANRSNEELEVVSKCANDNCGAPCDRYRNKKRCSTCRVPLLVCRDCQNKKVDKKEKLRCRLCKEEGRFHYVKGAMAVGEAEGDQFLN